MADITNPHDRFFKEVFSRPDVAEDFLVHYLPPDVSSLLRPGTFRLSKGSFVDANLREYFSDLLYQVNFQSGEQGFVYILFEHKSYPAPDIAFQLLRYMTRIWEHATKHTLGSLPAVIPIVLYHGTVKWKVPLNFASLYQAPESLTRSLWDFTYTLCDLSSYTDEEIKLGVMAKVALLLLKHIHGQDLAHRLKDILGLLRAMEVQTALEFLETVMRYLGAAAGTVTMEDCRKAIEATFHETGDIFMERWIDEIAAERHQQWKAEGLKEGLKEGAIAVTLRLLTRKIGDLGAGTEDRVRQLSFEQLERLGEDLLDIPDESALTEWLDRVDRLS
jgi:predicted transposase/invertase (TIGR01784 family)